MRGGGFGGMDREVILGICLWMVEVFAELGLTVGALCLWMSLSLSRRKGKGF